MKAYLICVLLVLLYGCINVGPGGTTGGDALVCPSVTPITTLCTPSPSQAGGPEVCAHIPEITGYAPQGGQTQPSTVARDTCYIAFAINRSDASICREILTVTSLQGCYLSVATVTGNASVCILLGTSDARTCYAQVAVAKSNPRVCDQISDEYEKGYCYSSYARDKRDASVCDLITSVSAKDDCYANTASALQNVTLCSRISDLNRRDGCYFNAAMNQRDASICELITNAQQKSNCLQNIQPHP